MIDIMITYSLISGTEVAWIWIRNLHPDPLIKIPLISDLVIYDRWNPTIEYRPIPGITEVSVDISTLSQPDQNHEEGYTELRMRIPPAEENKIITGRGAGGKWWREADKPPAYKSKTVVSYDKITHTLTEGEVLRIFHYKTPITIEVLPDERQPRRD